MRFRFATRDRAVAAAKQERQQIDARASLAQPGQPAKNMLFAANFFDSVVNAFKPRWLD
ncbi:hypothetical protein [Terrarubrum flagellatum]|uniref:hypothetical protein n=1 Tax=Terrirubrum flagellatum TaxID=2895980 RepID=UPI0031450819